MDYLIVVLLGLIMGSFCTVLVYRIPREIPLGFLKNTRSQCPECGKQIPWSQNIPLFTYLINKRRARCCGNKISRVYPLVEFLTALGFFITYWVYQHSGNIPQHTWAYYAELVKVLYFTLVLVAVIFIDLEFRIIPDRFSLGSWVIALVAAFAWGQPPIISSLVGALLGFGMFYLLAWGYEKLKGVEGLGFGDVKMMGWLGAWLGFEAVPMIILCASLSGIVVGVIAMRKSQEGLQTALPFGPFLALAAYAAWILQRLGGVFDLQSIL